MSIYFLADTTSSDLSGFSVLVFTVLGLIGLFLALCWIALPFIIISKFNELLKATRRIERAHNETNKALQWFVDKELESHKPEETPPLAY